MEDSRKKLYDAVSAKYDIGTFDEFSNKMNNPESQKKFYDATSKDFDIGTFDEFQGKISLKKKRTFRIPFTGWYACFANYKPE